MQKQKVAAVEQTPAAPTQVHDLLGFADALFASSFATKLHLEGHVFIQSHCASSAAQLNSMHL